MTRATPVPAVAGDPTDLGDDLLKLVSYIVVSLKPGAERVMPKSGATVMVTEPTTSEAFAAWRVAVYLASESYCSLAPEERLGPADVKYLQVDYRVSRRFQRRPLEFEARQLERLEAIDHGLRRDDSSPSTAADDRFAGGKS